MERWITVQDMRSPSSIYAAFQAAIDALTDPASIDARLATASQDPSRSEPVFWHPGSHPIASFNLFGGGNRPEELSLYAVIYLDHITMGGQALPEGFMNRLGLQVQSGEQIASRRFSAINLGKWYDSKVSVPAHRLVKPWRFSVVYI